MTSRQGSGVAWYVGIPEAGKTTLAVHDACSAAATNGWPLVVLDTAGVDQLAHVPAARSVAELERQVWTEGVHARFVPDDQEDVDLVCDLVLARRRVNLLVDEAADWLDAHRGKHSPLMRLLRRHRHARARVFLTTQHLSADVPQTALSCAPQLYVFRCVAPAVLDRLQRDYNLDPAIVANLPQGSYLRVSTGFDR